MSPLVTDDPGLLQGRCRFRHTLAAHTQHVADQILRHPEVPGVEVVQGDQQQAAKPLIQAVVAIAHGHLADLRHERLGIQQHQLCGRPAQFQRSHQHSSR
jgi:hypothetical protein